MKLAGPVAKGMYVSQYGIANEKLPSAREGVPRELRERASYRAGPDYAAAYGAQAAEILLYAIARSDGTRAVGHARGLPYSASIDGILGDIRFDRNGDLVYSPFTFFRIVGAPGRARRASFLPSTASSSLAPRSSAPGG